jgi:hypothetical protein
MSARCQGHALYSVFGDERYMPWALHAKAMPSSPFYRDFSSQMSSWRLSAFYQDWAIQWNSLVFTHAPTNTLLLPENKKEKYAFFFSLRKASTTELIIEINAFIIALFREVNPSTNLWKGTPTAVVSCPSSCQMLVETFRDILRSRTLDELHMPITNQIT